MVNYVKQLEAVRNGNISCLCTRGADGIHTYEKEEDFYFDECFNEFSYQELHQEIIENEEEITHIEYS